MSTLVCFMWDGMEHAPALAKCTWSDVLQYVEKHYKGEVDLTQDWAVGNTINLPLTLGFSYTKKGGSTGTDASATYGTNSQTINIPMQIIDFNHDVLDANYNAADFAGMGLSSYPTNAVITFGATVGFYDFKMFETDLSLTSANVSAESPFNLSTFKSLLDAILTQIGTTTLGSSIVGGMKHVKKQYRYGGTYNTTLNKTDTVQLFVPTFKEVLGGTQEPNTYITSQYAYYKKGTTYRKKGHIYASEWSSYVDRTSYKPYCLMSNIQSKSTSASNIVQKMATVSASGSASHVNETNAVSVPIHFCL